MMEKWIRRWLAYLKAEKGQSIVILAVAVVVLLAFVGLTIDVGRLYGTRIQLSRAVDAAALAGVMELPSEADADARARQFMRTNGIDPDQANMAIAAGGAVAIGQSNYLTVTAQLPMETMFLRFVGWETVQVPAMAVAEFKSPIEVYASQHPESGVTGVVNLSVFGKDSDRQWGDAFMGTRDSCSDDPNPDWRELAGKYPFRIHVPANYVARTGTSEIQVEILDPDCWNTDEDYFDIPWVETPTIDYNMPANSFGRKEVAVVDSNDPNNKVWQVRMDQYNPFCNAWGTEQPMSTKYSLYYYKENDREKHPIAQYEQGLDASTDLEWVVPSGFRFDLDTYSDVVMKDEDGNMSFFIDVEGLEGTYGNGFDLWAGPPPPPTVTVPTNVNERNVYLLRKIMNKQTTYHDSGGVVIWAIGYLPLNVNTDTVFTITLGYIPPEAAGTRLRVSSWDMDRGVLGISLDYYLEGVPDFHEPGTVSLGTEWAHDVFTIPDEFYGGYLYAVYHTSKQDTTDWKLEYLDVMSNSYVRLIK